MGHINKPPLTISKPLEEKKEATKDTDLDGKQPVEKIRVLFERHLNDIQRNQINGEWEINGQALTEEDMNSHLLEFQGETTGITEALFFRFLKSNNIQSYNPIHQFFQEHKKIKKTGLIKSLANSISTDTGTTDTNSSINFVEHFLTKWMVGAVAQAHGRGVNPLMLILAGTKQNTGKTHWFRELLPQELREYFAEPKGMSDLKDADLGMLLTENFLVLDDEMAGRTWKDYQRMKSMLSMASFTMRRPYDKRQRKYPRLASLCATNNNLDLLGDPTGNRRMIPINVLSIDHESYNKIDKAALWLEAYHLMESDFEHNLKQDDIQLLNDCTKDFEVVDETIELIDEYFMAPEESSYGRMTATQVTQVLMRYSTFKHLHPNRIGERLRKMGYKQRRDNSTGSRTWVIEAKPNYSQQ